MSWKYPEHPLKNGNVVGIDDINRNLTEFAEEVDGGLNEHNWERDSFVRSDCADDVSIEVWKNSVKQDPSINYMDTIEEFSQLRQIPAWSPVKSASYSASETITTGSCVLWIMYTGQHRQASSGFNEGIAQFAIRVNGTIIPETITGSASSSRDVVHHESQDSKSPFPGIAANRPHRAVVFGAGDTDGEGWASAFFFTAATGAGGVAGGTSALVTGWVSGVLTAGPDAVSGTALAT